MTLNLPTRWIALVAFAMLMLPTSASAAIIYGPGSYATDLPSSAPTGLTPANGTTVAYPDDALAFGWNPVPGTTTYQIQVARLQSAGGSCTSASAFSANFITVDAKSNESAWIPTMTSEATGSKIWTGTFCWRVRSSGVRPGAWSAPQKFTRDWSASPSRLRFYNDTDGATPRPTSASDFATGSTTTEGGGYLTWSPIDGAATYQVQVGAAPTFSDSSTYLWRDGIRDNRVALIHLPDNTYYWRVRAVAPNGTEGAWSTEAASFTVAWDADNLKDSSKLYPANGSTVSDMRIGWTPVPGASYYQYQIGALRNGQGDCTWDPNVPGTVPDVYGDWTNIAPEFDSGGGLIRTSPRSPSQCRLSPVNATTVNNWVTLQDAWDPAVFANLSKDCLSDEGEVECARAEFPEGPSKVIDEPTVFRGSAMAAGEEDSGPYTIQWRVRPVYELSQTVESGWSVTGNHTVYGSWSSVSGDWPTMNLDTATATSSTVSRCSTPCLEHSGSVVEVGSAAGSSTSLQMPVLTWKPYPGATGYVVQLARDRNFNNPLVTKVVPGDRTVGYGWQQSWAPKIGYPDDVEGTGYWWRVIPCKSSVQVDGSLTACVKLYNETQGGWPAPFGSPAYADGGQAQTFTKHSKLQTSVVDNFEGAAPLIRWASDDVTGPNDHEGWARGLDGASHYEVQLSRSPSMSSPIVLKTTMPYIVPSQPTETPGITTELPDGLWYYKVRAVDHNDLAGSWTTAANFSKHVASPGSVTSGGGPTAYGSGAIRINWQAVTGATQYEVQWSLSDDFSTGVNKATTAQTTFLIPSSSAGAFHWRVRAIINGAPGDWTYADVAGGGPVNVTQGTQIQSAVSRFATPVGQTMQVYGKLLVNGEPVDGKLVFLQIKNTTCNAAGSYANTKSTTSGASGEEGTFGFNIKPDRNRCFRWAYTDAGVTVYSAPISVTARPVTSVRFSRTRMLRKQPFTYTLRSNQAINGRVRFQYQVGRTWVTAHTVNVRFMKVRTQRVFINRAGTFNTRIAIEGMYGGAARFTTYVNVYQRGPRVRVNDLWRVYR